MKINSIETIKTIILVCLSIQLNFLLLKYSLDSIGFLFLNKIKDDLQPAKQSNTQRFYIYLTLVYFILQFSLNIASIFLVKKYFQTYSSLLNLFLITNISYSIFIILRCVGLKHNLVQTYWELNFITNLSIASDLVWPFAISILSVCLKFQEKIKSFKEKFFILFRKVCKK